MCQCEETDDCGGGYCVDRDAVPNACERYSNESACNEHQNDQGTFGCEWMDTIQVTTKGGTCEVALPQGKCVAFSRVLDGCATNDTCHAGSRVYYRDNGTEDDLILINEARCGDEPLGWTQCAMGDTRPICACACAAP
jgi:hypothetical protein